MLAGAGRVGAAGFVASEGGANKGFVGDAGAAGAGGATRGFVAVGAARPGIGEPVLSLMVGAPVLGAVLSLIVGAGAGRAIGPAVLSGMVGAGAGGPPGAVGAGIVAAGIVAAGGRAKLTVGVGGLGAGGGTAGADATIGEVGGATGTVADGMAGASLARNVTRTVSFFKGMAAVCFLGTYWSSLMGLILCEDTKPKNGSDVKRGISSLQSFFQKNGTLLPVRTTTQQLDAPLKSIGQRLDSPRSL